MKLDERTAIVTGSSRGIGRAIALKLAANGARLLVGDLDPGPANETIELIRERNRRPWACWWPKFIARGVWPGNSSAP
jgi:3-oxoacyl-[acyl-carrier protein] reductase